MQEGTTTNYLLDPLYIESQNIKATEDLLIDEENLGEKVRKILELELRAFNLLFCQDIQIKELKEICREKPSAGFIATKDVQEPANCVGSLPQYCLLHTF